MSLSHPDTQYDPKLLYQGTPATCTQDSQCSGRCGWPGIHESEVKKVQGDNAHKTCCPGSGNNRRNGLCTSIPTGDYCEDDNYCANGPICGHPGDSSQPKICCPHGTYQKFGGLKHCRGGAVGDSCEGSKGCENGACGHPGSKSRPKICCPSGKAYDGGFGIIYCQDSVDGSECSGDRGCASGNCCSGTCTEEKCSSLSPTTIFIIISVIIIVFLILLIIIYFILK